MRPRPTTSYAWPSTPQSPAPGSSGTSSVSSAEHLGRGVYEGVWVGPDSKIPNTRGIRNDVVAALKALKVPNVRWPGGCFADEYHWRNGIGPRDQRPPTLNPNWGGVIEPNTFGTHEFFDFLEQIGADAYLSINVGSGTPAESADWLEYLTTPQPTALQKQRAANGHPEPYRVPILGLGNESWGCGGSMTPEYYTDLLKVYSRYARNYNPNQKMRRIAVGPDSADPSYTEAVMAAWKNKTWAWDIEGISLHYYTVGEVAAGIQVRGLRRAGLRRAAAVHAAHVRPAETARRQSWTSTTRRRRSSCPWTSGACGWKSRRARPKDSSSSRTASAMPSSPH